MLELKAGEAAEASRHEFPGLPQLGEVRVVILRR